MPVELQELHILKSEAVLSCSRVKFSETRTFARKKSEETFGNVLTRTNAPLCCAVKIVHFEKSEAVFSCHARNKVRLCSLCNK